MINTLKQINQEFCLYPSINYTDTKTIHVNYTEKPPKTVLDKMAELIQPFQTIIITNAHLFE